ncbi:MAG: macro domain-containing protein [Arthrospira sp. SH-MAG29]|nr:macro domain-containing protein [Arthrospira sp. SH-MAG29]MBS0018179.1 macro domain-containing protein [Arthrospira sp. SH-MAG29]
MFFEIPGLIMQFFGYVIVPISGQLLKFAIPKIKKIPSYINLLFTIYKDQNIEAEARKILTASLLIIGHILAFLASSYIPLTGMPILGLFTTPIAAAIAIVISLVTFDIVLKLNGEYLKSKYGSELEDIQSDRNELIQSLGDSWEKTWEKTVKETQKILDAVKSKLDPDKDYDSTIVSLINGLFAYLKKYLTNESLSPTESELQIITDGLPPVAKITGSVAEGATMAALTGAGVHGAASSMFVQASLWTSIQSALGLGGGIAVSASAYSLLTLAAPITLAAVAGVGISHGALSLRNKNEQRKLSAFLADVFIASLPMAWADGEFSDQERDTLESLLLHPWINKKDAQRVRNVIEHQQSFDQVIAEGLLKEQKPEKAKIKYRFLLAISWELAKADGRISEQEKILHNRIAEFTKTPLKEVEEIRRIILLKSGINLSDHITVIQGDITQQPVDAIVCSTNPHLLPNKKWGSFFMSSDHPEVDVMIHKSAGVELKQECQKLNGCKVGEAKITPGYNLPAEWVIHTVSPTWQNGEVQAEKLLAKCYQNCLNLVNSQEIESIAFPALGTGTGKFPLEKAARIAVTEMQKFLTTYFQLQQIILVCNDQQTYDIYRQIVTEIVSSLSLPCLPDETAVTVFSSYP